MNKFVTVVSKTCLITANILIKPNGVALRKIKYNVVSNIELRYGYDQRECNDFVSNYEEQRENYRFNDGHLGYEFQ